MITEDYVSLNTAKLLKEKGFDWEVHRSYLVNDNVFIPGDINDVPLRKDVIRIPTIQMAMKWLREVHNIAIETEWEHLWYAYVKPMTSKPSEEDYYQCESSKYEEVCESAIRYCLKNVI